MGRISNILVLTFLLLLVKKAVVDSSSSSRCLENELEALMEFKASLNNDTNLLSSWMGHDCCSWHGITCDNHTRHVKSLYLGDYLHLPNYFNSPLSPWLFNVTHLEVLSLGYSGLKGLIPNMFERLIFLTHLDLSGNSFDSGRFPDSLCSLTHLTSLDLTGVQLYGSLPFCLQNLSTSLSELRLGYNSLSGEIPGWLNHFTNLTSLDLSRNLFSSIDPSSFGHQQQLEYLFLYNNQLSGSVPYNVGNLTKLKSLYVSDNFLTIELSEFFFERLTRLDRLYIGGNMYHVFNVSPKWIPHFQLSVFDMDDNFMETQFPSWLQTQTNLNILYMRNASIYGTIPVWFPSAFPNLVDVILSNNLLSGSIPDQCETVFPNVIRIDLSNNLLTGNIPKKLCGLKNLEILSLANNQLTGRIPSCLGSLRLLTALDLVNNNLSGVVPYELGSLRDLESLHLNGNKLSGKLSSSFQNWVYLKTLDLGDNELQGSIPQWIGKNLSSLRYLRLESNKFSGDIPVNLCQLPFLQILNLAHNNLLGTIPPCIGNLPMMLSEESGENSTYVQDFYHEKLLNSIKGMEREYSSSLLYAKFISLSGNYLHGEIPIELMNLKGLQSLNLSSNELTGMIPRNINNMKHLESLDLSMNQLSGTIPQTLADIDGLSYLNLSFNNLAGKLPSGKHFDTLNVDPSIYRGNPGLCGELLMKSCPRDDLATYDQPNVDGDDEFDWLSWFYAGIGPGCVVGFLGVVCILYFKDTWRIAYFGFVDNVCDKCWVTFRIKFSQFQSKFN